MRWPLGWPLYAASEEAIEHISNSVSDCFLELGVRQVFDADYNQRMHARGGTNYYAYDIDYLGGILNIALDRSDNEIGSYVSDCPGHRRRYAHLSGSPLDRPFYQAL